MTISRRIDGAPRRSTHGVRLGLRLRALGSQPLKVAGATVIVLLLLASIGTILGAVLADGGPHSEALIFGLFLLLAGIVGVVSLYIDLGKDAVLRGLAHDTDLLHLESSQATHYAGSRFRDGSRVILQGVRTPGFPFVEVGDSWSLNATAGQPGLLAAGAVVAGASKAPQREVYLRLRLRGPVLQDVRYDGAEPAAGTMDPMPRLPGKEEPYIAAPIDAYLQQLIGPYVLEARGDEVTVFGSRPMAATTPERLEELLELARALAERAEETLLPEGSDHLRTTGHGAQGAEEPQLTAPAHPAVAVLTVLAMLIVGPLAIALIMAWVDQYTLGNPVLARLVVSVVIGVVLIVVAAVMRRLLRRRMTTADALARRRRRWRIALAVAGAVVLPAAALFTWGVVFIAPFENDPDRDLDTVAECATDDDYCQWNVAQRNWARDLGYTRAFQDDFADNTCTTSGPDAARCELTLECPEDAQVTNAHLIVEYRGTPWEVVGVGWERGDGDLASAPEDVEALVAEVCAG